MQLSNIFAWHKVATAYQQLCVCVRNSLNPEKLCVWGVGAEKPAAKAGGNSCPGICFLKLEMGNSSKDSDI